jgi:hypothetical protein
MSVATILPVNHDRRGQLAGTIGKTMKIRRLRAQLVEALPRREGAVFYLDQVSHHREYLKDNVDETTQNPARLLPIPRLSSPRQRHA